MLDITLHCRSSQAAQVPQFISSAFLTEGKRKACMDMSESHSLLRWQELLEMIQEHNKVGL